MADRRPEFQVTGFRFKREAKQSDPPGVIDAYFTGKMMLTEATALEKELRAKLKATNKPVVLVIGILDGHTFTALAQTEPAVLDFSDTEPDSGEPSEPEDLDESEEPAEPEDLDL